MTKIRLPPHVIAPTGVETVYELIRDYSLLRVAVVDSIVTTDGDDIRTWYKLRILETLTKQPLIPAGELPSGVPSRLLPVKDGETIYVVSAGSVPIDGVTLVQTPPEPGLVLRKEGQYTCAFFLEYSGRLATPAAASSAIFEIDGDELKPQGDPENELVKNVRLFFNNSVSHMRTDVRRRVGSQAK